MTFNKKISMKKNNNYYKKYNSRKHSKYLSGGSGNSNSSSVFDRIEIYVEGMYKEEEEEALKFDLVKWHTNILLGNEGSLNDAIAAHRARQKRNREPRKEKAAAAAVRSANSAPPPPVRKLKQSRKAAAQQRPTDLKTEANRRGILLAKTDEV